MVPPPALLHLAPRLRPGALGWMRPSPPAGRGDGGGWGRRVTTSTLDHTGPAQALPPSAPLADFAVDHLDIPATPGRQVIGGGVIGLAVAARLCQRHPTRSTLLLDQHPRIGAETSSRNSEVIHAGIYYPPDSWKTKLCIRGAELLYAYCQRRRIPHRQVGKWIVAQDAAGVRKLEGLERHCHTLGISTLRLDEGEVRRQEPHVRALQVLVSPRTGILDSHAFMEALHADIVEGGADGTVSLNSRVVGAQPHPALPGYLVRVVSGTAAGSPSAPFPTILHARHLVNAAGLYAQDVAAMLLPPDQLQDYALHLCKGHYYGYRPLAGGGGPLVQRLVYPIPEAHLTGLGIHVTVDLGGRVKFGPDAEYVSTLDYGLGGPQGAGEEARRRRFHAAIQAYLPEVRLEQLYPDYCGIRPKLSGPGQLARDFGILEGPDSVHLLGMESPGLTSSLAVAERVERLLYPHG